MEVIDIASVASVAGEENEFAIVTIHGSRTVFAAGSQRESQRWADELTALVAKHGHSSIGTIAPHGIIGQSFDGSMIEPGAHLLFIAKNLERIGDHATNVAEVVHYLVTGQELTADRPRGPRPETS